MSAPQRQQVLRARPNVPAAAGAAGRAAATQTAQQQRQQQRIQQLESKRHLSRTERHELQRLQRNQRRNAQAQPGAQPGQPTQANARATAQQQRLQELQSRQRLTPSERRELQRLQRNQQQNAQQQPGRNGRPNAQQPGAAQAALGGVTQNPNRPQRPVRSQVTQQQVVQGRFASNLTPNPAYRERRYAGRREARLVSRVAWHLGLLAPYIPWYGPVYWPYAYNDVFYYTFWPYAYDPGYWAYAYDDFFDGVFFPEGAPYVEYAAAGPYASVTTGTAPSGGRTVVVPGRVTQSTREFCTDQAKGVTAWPLKEIADAVQPTPEQQRLLDDLRQASEQAAAQFKEACPTSVPLTPPGRLQAMTMRLQAIDDAIKTVRPALVAFYNSLSDEQKARFNEIGPQLGKQPQAHATASQDEKAEQANCSSEKAGLSNLAINRIEEVLQPNDAQEAALDRLDDAMQKAIDGLRAACPSTIPLTPVGRLDAMQKRTEALIDAANTVRPALDDFYASLSNEQKAKFNRLGRESAQASGD